MGRRLAVLLTAGVLAAVVVASAVGPAAGAAPKVRIVTKTFSSPTSINTPSSGPGAPYPSIRNVSFGRGAKILDVNLALRGYVHTRADDAEVLLVAPGGKRIVAMSDVGGPPTSATSRLRSTTRPRARCQTTAR